ncbi:killer toxin Kp4/SMK [Paecilomyces variotii]|uniref:Killer toxin Kp4/SMK n=1 Tax=Byssochlamys spectabilis TaxID=264951 RepID=A0A443HRS3_BYSSP|nr:killer toxin Kp4/SMK [Paecilomyces variotii]KAJ9365561.1 hypothetical protein DTO280E4_530 [Paecilomyces variotii]RWQ94470.1 killer toxin Kp4/SMK [Paecilomyces variotii]
MHYILNLTLITLGISSASEALGINCRGSSNCGGTLCSLSTIYSAVEQLPDGNLYNPGQHIACCGDPGVVSGLCAFTQNTDKQISAAQAKTLLQGLINHGCQKCGSNPFQDNNVAEGELTVNYVSQK